MGKLDFGLEHAQVILDSMPFGIDVVDSDLKIIYLNKFFLDIFGKKAIGKKCHAVYKDNKKQCENCPLKKPIKPRETRTIEASGVAGGRIFRISHTGIKLSSGKKAILEFFQDITKIKETEEKLAKQGERFKIITEQSPDLIFILKPNGYLEYVSPVVKELLGYTPEEAIGQHFKKFVRTQDLPHALKIFASALAGNPVKQFELPLRRKDGFVTNVEISGKPIIKEGKLVSVVGYARDLSLDFLNTFGKKKT